MRATEFLIERISSRVFHYTRVTTALKILQSGQFELSHTLGTSWEAQFAPEGYPYFLSTTRTRHGGYHGYLGQDAVLFELDGDFYNQRYPGKAVDYWNNRDPMKDHHKAHEAEDRIFSRDNAIPAAIRVIDLYIAPDADEAARARTRQVIILAKKAGIAVNLFNDQAAWRQRDTRRLADVSQLRGQDSARGYVERRRGGYLKPWMELIQAKQKSQLSKDADSKRYALQYTYDKQEMTKSLSVDLSNARKPGPDADRNNAVRVIQFMQQNRLGTVNDLVNFLADKWKNTKEGVAEAANPVTFAGKDPNLFKSPKGGTPVMVIVTDQGSRYLITSDGMVLRNKSAHANTGGEDAGLQAWSEHIEFYDRSKPLVAGAMQALSFPDAVTYLFDKGRVALSKGQNGERVALILDNNQWRAATIADAMPKAAQSKPEWARIIIKAEAGTWGAQPKLGWQPLDYNQRPDGTLNRVHNGSPVSHGAKVQPSVAEGTGFDQEAGIGLDGESFKFKIKDLVALANKYPVTPIDPRQFTQQIKGRNEDPTQSMARAEKADLQYPIIVVQRKNGKLWIADGTHRAHKAILNKIPKINAKIIPIKDMSPFSVKQGVAEASDLQEIEAIPAQSFSGGKDILDTQRLPAKRNLKPLPGGTDLLYAVEQNQYVQRVSIVEPGMPGITKPHVVALLNLDTVTYLPNTVQVQTITVDEHYRGRGLAKALYGIVFTVMRKNLLSGASQTPGGRRNWMSLANIPGVEVKGLVRILDRVFDIEPHGDRIIDQIMALGGQFFTKNNHNTYWLFDVVPGKGSLQPAVRNSLSKLYDKDSDTLLLATWSGNQQGVSEGLSESVNDYLWHGSRNEHKVLYPQQAKDTGGKEESNKNAVYATPNAKFAIAMGLTTPGSDFAHFPNDSQGVLFSGNLRKGEMVYLHKVPKDLFIKHNGREWYSKPGVSEVKPIEVVTVPVDKYLNLIRQATPQDWKLRQHYLDKAQSKEQGVAEGVMSDLDQDRQDANWDAIVGYVINGLKKNQDIGHMELALYKWGGKELVDVDQELEDRGFRDLADLADHITQHGGQYQPPKDFGLDEDRNPVYQLPELTLILDPHFIERMGTRQLNSGVVAQLMARLKNLTQKLSQFEPGQKIWVNSPSLKVKLGMRRQMDRNGKMTYLLKTVVKDGTWDNPDPTITVENFADGKVKGRSRPGRVKRAGASCDGSVTDLRAKAKKYGGERGKMYHWCGNMKSGRSK